MSARLVPAFAIVLASFGTGYLLESRIENRVAYRSEARVAGIDPQQLSACALVAQTWFEQHEKTDCAHTVDRDDSTIFVAASCLSSTLGYALVVGAVIDSFGEGARCASGSVEWLPMQPLRPRRSALVWGTCGTSILLIGAACAFAFGRACVNRRRP